MAPEGGFVLPSSPDRVTWMLTDNMGSVRDLLDKDGNLVAGGHYRYDAFGNILAGDTSLTRYLYTAGEHDVDTGVQYNRNRWYDPSTGRWLSEDPIGFAAGDSDLYRYAGNNVRAPSVSPVDSSPRFFNRPYRDAKQDRCKTT